VYPHNVSLGRKEGGMEGQREEGREIGMKEGRNQNMTCQVPNMTNSKDMIEAKKLKWVT